MKRDSEENLKFSLVNARKVSLTGVKLIGEKIEKDNVLEIQTTGESIAIGDVICINNQKFKPTIIKRVSKKTNSGITNYELYSHKLSKSSQFLMPFLGFNRFKFRWNLNFCNCFIGLEDHGDYGDYLYLMYRFDGSMEFLKFEKELMEHPDYEETIDLDVYHTIYKFKMTDNYVKDSKLILDGKYSRISDFTKQRILEFNSSNELKPLGQILFRSEERRLSLAKEYMAEIDEETELFERFKPKEEILLNKYLIKKR